MVTLRNGQQGLILKHYNEDGWCLRGWNRVRSGRKAGSMRKSKKFLLGDITTINEITHSLKVQLDCPLYAFDTVVMVQEDVRLILHKDYIALRSKGFLYKVFLDEELRKSLISQLSKIKRVG